MRIHHIALRTPDVAALERFYVDVVGLRVTKRGASIWLDADGTIVMLESRTPGEPAPATGSLDLVAFAIDADSSIERRLADIGVAIEGRTPSTIYARDPDGRRIGFSVYPARLTRGAEP